MRLIFYGIASFPGSPEREMYTFSFAFRGGGTWKLGLGTRLGSTELAMQAKLKGSRFSNWEKILGWSWVLFATALARAGMDNVIVACEMQRLKNGHFKNVHVRPSSVQYAT